MHNIGGGKERTNLDNRAHLKKLGKAKTLISYVIDRPGHDRRYAIDSSHLQKTLGWRPDYTLEADIRRMIERYTENTNWVFR